MQKCLKLLVGGRLVIAVVVVGDLLLVGQVQQISSHIFFEADFVAVVGERQLGVEGTKGGFLSDRGGRIAQARADFVLGIDDLPFADP